MHLPGHSRPIIATKFNPNKYKLRDGPSLLKLEYRYIYAVATQDSLVLYDTQQTEPIAFMSKLHYATLSDIAWSSDGNNIMISSTDGFCSLVEFQGGELGEYFDVRPEISPAAEPAAAPKITEKKVSEIVPDDKPLEQKTGLDKMGRKRITPILLQ
jgi:chromatin assembly factor 1 subunit B